MQRIKYLCKLYLDNYHSDSTVESIALSKHNSDVALLNYTNNTIIVSYLKNYTEYEEALAFTYWDNNKLVGYMDTILFEYDIKMFHVKQLKGVVYARNRKKIKEANKKHERPTL